MLIVLVTFGGEGGRNTSRSENTNMRLGSRKRTHMNKQITATKGILTQIGI